MILLIIGALLTALLHYYIFYLELLAYGKPAFNRTFRIPEAELPIVRAPFNNLAIYNLAIAVFATLGLLIRVLSNGEFGQGVATGLLFASLGTALMAGVYLFISQNNKRRPALIQATPALLGLIGIIFP